jgi:hypothetical protein
MKRFAAVFLLALAPALAHADSVFLKSGGEIKGEIVERRADAVVIEVGPGRLTLPLSAIARIESNTTDIGVYRSRAAALAALDVRGWLNLAAWAQARDLATLAREAYLHVLAIDPANAAAHLGIGDVQMADRWLSPADANRARGLVEFEGTWMTPEERQARIEERVVMAQERQAERAAEAQAREADARVREAEARARAAETEARMASEPSSGIPYPYVFGGGGYGPGAYGPYNPFPPVHMNHRRDTQPIQPVRPPAQVPPPVRINPVRHDVPPPPSVGKPAH